MAELFQKYLGFILIYKEYSLSERITIISSITVVDNADLSGDTIFFRTEHTLSLPAEDTGVTKTLRTVLWSPENWFFFSYHNLMIAKLSSSNHFGSTPNFEASIDK